MMPVKYLGRNDEFPSLDIPLFLEAVPAGFPSPASDYCERTLDLNELCVKKPAATYFVRVQGDSMVEAGIFPDDIIVVDRSLTAQHGDIVIAAFNGELTIKKLETAPQTRLVPMNRNHAPIPIPEGADLEIFGVATTVIHSLRKS
jgi:DNA polymerase V